MYQQTDSHASTLAKSLHDSEDTFLFAEFDRNLAALADDAFHLNEAFDHGLAGAATLAALSGNTFDFMPFHDHGVDGHASDHGATNSRGTVGSIRPHLDGTVHTGTNSTYTPVDGFSNINGDPVTHVVFSPPDNGLATSGQSVVSAVNDTIGWFSPSLQGFKYEAFSQFFPSSLVGKMYFTDPQVLYDAVNHHYIVTEELYGSNSSQSKVLIAVSKDAGPDWTDFSSFNADWNFFSINTSVKVGGKATAIDFPQAATDGTNLYISGDQFAGNSYVGNSKMVIPLSVIEAAHPTSSSLSYSPTMTNLKMTMDAAADPHGGCYFVGYEGASNSTLGEYATIAHTLLDGRTTTYQVPVGQIDNLSVTTLVATEVGGHQIDASDRRVIDAELIGNKLFAVAEVAPPGSNTPLLHWFEFDTGKLGSDTAHALVDQGDITLGPGITTYNGSVAADAKGDMIINFTASGPSLNPADYYELHLAGSSGTGQGFWGAPTQYAASPTSYSDGYKISRWGDYSSAIADPNDHNGHSGFYVSNEYAVDASHWGTANAWVLV